MYNNDYSRLPCNFLNTTYLLTLTTKFQSLPHQIFKAKSRLILPDLSDDLLLYGAQRLLLSQSVNEFDVEVTPSINISEE